MRRLGRDREEVTERDDVRREPLPTARAILWKPLPDSYHLLASMMRTTEEQVHLFVTQRAFLQVERHLRSAPELELGGFLAGHLYECPRSGVRYSVLNTVLPFADVTGDPIGSRVTQKAFDTVRKRLEAHRLWLLGWYRNGSGLGLQLLPDDIETHITYFDQPWQTTMLVVPDPANAKGAFFTYDARAGRSYCIPFYELFTNAVEGNGMGRTCVGWTTYVPSAPVEPLPVTAKEIVETTVAPMRNASPEPEPAGPLDEWWDAIKDPWVRLRSVATNATQRERPLPLVFRSKAPAPTLTPSRAEQKRSPIVVEERRPPDEVLSPVSSRPPEAVPQKDAPRPAARSTEGIPQPTNEAPRPQTARATPPFAGPPRPAAARPAPARPAPPRPAASRPAEPRKAPPRPAAEPRPSQAPSAVALPPDFHEDAIRWERRRRIGLAIAGVSFVAAIALSSLRSRPHTVAQAATSAAASAEMVAPSAPESENGHAPVSLASAVDSLSGALAYYRDIADNHREGLVGCRVLDRAYALVGRARVRVDSTRRQVTGDLSAADSIRVSMLGAEFTYVAQTYQRSGCGA